MTNPSQEQIAEALKFPNGWVYEIDSDYQGKEQVPPEAIKGAWKVDAKGAIEGEFIPNPNYHV
jgi:hypothetical protein